MNLSLFLTPKKDVAWVPLGATMQEALQKLEARGYTAVPLLDDKGLYVGTLTEGDLLWKMRADGLSFADTAKVPLGDVPLRRANRPFRIESRLDGLMALVETQNFVPIVDGRRFFHGIITRKAIIGFLSGRLRVLEGLAAWTRDEMER